MLSLFCPQCGTIFDITQSLSNKTSQEGGEDDNIENMINMILNNAKISQNDINKIGNISVSQITEHPMYTNLDLNEKNTVYNKIQIYLPHKKNMSMYGGNKAKPLTYEHSGGNKAKPLTYEHSGGEPVEKSNKNLAYYRCKYCNYTKPIKSGTRIYSKSSEHEIGQTSFDTKNMKYNPINPFTRYYICPNEKCISHKNPKKKEAKFFRVGDNYKTTYICMACDESFSVNLSVKNK
uniref:Uncharacterized protein n=1 Tax=Mimivirus LCMiAC02 TaxID=2506609 RepID=A0A481Z1W4_9VIRU|nr:MAG: uncharacterized protein LCMiAC02_02650 [Mimivirus LCMiAC02]